MGCVDCQDLPDKEENDHSSGRQAAGKRPNALSLRDTIDQPGELRWLSVQAGP